MGLLHSIDFTSWQNLLATVIGLALFTLIGVGIRLLAMVTIQQRRERLNRQINERVRTLIAAYRTLGGSFTGDLTVDPMHLRDLRRPSVPPEGEADVLDLSADKVARSDRARRIRDAVEAALSDIVLLGTEEHVRLASRGARELVAGHPVHTQELVISLRAFIREALDLAPIPADIELPAQGPARPSASGGGKGERGKEEGRQGGGGGSGMGGGMGAGMGGGMGVGLGSLRHEDDPSSGHGT
ncbi:hypothetical protein FZC33_18920 [Labrys sp. KNU-23]|uniref:hypothetical protein n=1 Tax=Labrys sp. KNU-23 TaxID=2789216 RepID=UPI0011ED26BB|nr:hypothetical protein [Labrys sp. KNU-23]QEN88250.1 hypothetical protein FZC33_18920 [Labrys sp. KNU-23]